MRYVLTILLIASVICAILLIRYAYARRTMPGAKYFAFLLVTAILYNGCYIGELNARNFETAKFWFDIEHIAIPLQHYFFLLLSLEFTNLNKKTFRIAKVLALYHPILYGVIFYVPCLTKFYASNFSFVERGSLYVIQFDNGILYYTMVISGTLIGIVSSFAYIIGYLKASNLQRKIYLIMMVATLFPWMTVYLHAFKVDFGVDLFPFSTIITGSLYMLCIFQFKIFHTIPIATEMVFRQATEGIILVDREEKIVDANVSAINIFPILTAHTKKLHLSNFVEIYPQLIPLLLNRNKFSFEYLMGEEQKHFEVNVQSIQMQNNLRVGKIIQLSDVTERYIEKKEMEELVTNAIDQIETSEISLLQAQISPHFINNSLSIIGSMITRAPEEAKALLTDLGDYLANCYYFDSSTYLVDLKEEVETVKTYVKIEQARFRERLQFHIERDEMTQVKVPRLIIQPLVENAIRHGILKKIVGGNVWLTIHKNQEWIEFEIKDDGVGMTEEFLDKLLHEGAAGKGIGVRNINNRLKKYYGEGLDIKSSPEKGTTIQFRIPVSSND